MIDKWVRQATLEDVQRIAPKLRPEDRAESKAGSGFSPEESLPLMLWLSLPDCYVVHNGGEPYAVYGATPNPLLPEGYAMVWMFATPDIMDHSRRFLRHCREGVDRLNQKFPLLHCLADERNTVHLRWLRWCDFQEVKRHQAFGPEGRPFIEFIRKRGGQCVPS